MVIYFYLELNIMRFYGNLFLPRTEYNEVLWRNWLARSTVNREAAGSSPARTDFFITGFMDSFSTVIF